MIKRCLFVRLQEDNIENYLTDKSAWLPFAIKDIERIEAVDKYSNSNYLFKIIISQPQSVYYLKQGWIYNRRSELRGQPFLVDPSRILGEVKLIGLLARLWNKDCVPQIYFLDKKNHIFLMSDVSKKGKLLIDEFNKNLVHPEMAKSLAAGLAKLHIYTYQTKLMPGCSTAYVKFMKRYLFRYHWGYGVDKLIPKKLVDKFYRIADSVPSSIIWADPVYRNIFIKPQGKVGLVDFDFSIRYDPMADVAILLSHWVWMTLKDNQKVKQDSNKFINIFNKIYWSYWQRSGKINKNTIKEMKLRTNKWIGIYLLSRTDGLSGSYFKKWPAWEKRIRQHGLELFNK